MSRPRDNLGYTLSLPEPALRAAAVSLGGLLQEATHVRLSGWLRRSSYFELDAVHPG